MRTSSPRSRAQSWCARAVTTASWRTCCRRHTEEETEKEEEEKKAHCCADRYDEQQNLRVFTGFLCYRNSFLNTAAPSAGGNSTWIQFPEIPLDVLWWQAIGQTVYKLLRKNKKMEMWKNDVIPGQIKNNKAQMNLVTFNMTLPGVCYRAGTLGFGNLSLLKTLQGFFLFVLWLNTNDNTGVRLFCEAEGQWM